MSVLWLLVRKQLREARWTLASSCGMLALIFALGTYLYRTFGDTGAEAMARVSPQLMVGLFGGLLGGLSQLELWLITLYLHPLMLTLLAAMTISIASRSLAGEMERGTLDLLLARPVSRNTLVLATAVTMQLALLVMVGTTWWATRLGLWLGALTPPDSLGRYLLVAVNLWALFTAASGVELLLSATTSEQGKAIGRAIAFLVLSFFANLVASLWPRLSWIDLVSIFHYHQPQPVVSGEAGLGRDLSVLIALAIVAHAGALFAFGRRDLPAR